MPSMEILRSKKTQDKEGLVKSHLIWPQLFTSDLNCSEWVHFDPRKRWKINLLLPFTGVARKQSPCQGHTLQVHVKGQSEGCLPHYLSVSASNTPAKV